MFHSRSGSLHEFTDTVLSLIVKLIDYTVPLVSVKYSQSKISMTF